MYGANGMATVLARAAMTGRRRGAFWRHRGPQPLQHPRRDHQSWSTISIRAPPPVIWLQPTVSRVEDETRRGFMAAFPGVVKDLTDAVRELRAPDHATEWFTESLQYNVPGGKKNRGLSLVLSYKTLCPRSELSDENLKLSYTLGWCVEILQAFLLVMDDVMDNAITRRGRPCWYRHNDIGLMAVNDGVLLEQAIYQLVKKYFKDKPYYADILDLFHDVTMQSAVGQCLDMLIAKSFQSKKMDKYTMENYTAIVKYKTAYYSFLLPVCLAMRMANINDPDKFNQAKTILLEMGYFFQVQDDFLDCYGDPDITGKIGTDIEDGKCSWLAVTALQQANSQQKIIMEENYGIDDPANVAVIKELYEHLKLQNIFQQYEEDSYKIISAQIQQVSRGSSQDLFFKFLKKMYKRTL